MAEEAHEEVVFATKTHLSILYLESALVFAHECREIEDLGEAASDADQSRHRSLALATVIVSVGMLESGINEFFRDALDGFSGTFAGHDPRVVAALAEE